MWPIRWPSAPQPAPTSSRSRRSPANQVTASANALGPVVTANLGAVASSTFTINGAAGNDELNVYAARRTPTSIAINGSTVAITGLKTVNYTAIEALNVFAREGSDTFTVTYPAAPA